MCEALRELMKEELEEREETGRIEGEMAGEWKVKIHLIQTKLPKGKTVESIAEDLEESDCKGARLCKQS